MATMTDERRPAQEPRPRRWRIPRPIASPKFPETETRQLAHHFEVRLARAVSVIERTGCTPRKAASVVGVAATIDRMVELRCRKQGVQLRLPLKIKLPSDRKQRAVTAKRVGHWRVINPQRQIELSAVAAAIARRDLVRGTTCGKCGSDRNIVAGPITLQPLRVEWRCRRCSCAMRRMK